MPPGGGSKLLKDKMESTDPKEDWLLGCWPPEETLGCWGPCPLPGWLAEFARKLFSALAGGPGKPT